MVIAERIKVYVKTEESQCGTLEGVCILHDIRGKCLAMFQGASKLGAMEQGNRYIPFLCDKNPTIF